MKMKSETLFHEASIPGKGCALLAARDIKPGETILKESPLIVVPWWIRHSMFPAKEKKDWLTKAVRELTSDQRRNFFELHDSKVGEKDPKTIDGIWRTNNFALGPSGPKSDNGLFLQISRINHSCVPYAEFVWNEEIKIELE